MAVCNNSFGRRRCPPNPEQDMHSVGGSHIFFTHLTLSIELSLFGIVPASSKRYYLETISIPRTFASCSSLRPHPPLDTGLKFCALPPAARCDGLMLMKRSVEDRLLYSGFSGHQYKNFWQHPRHPDRNRTVCQNCEF